MVPEGGCQMKARGGREAAALGAVHWCRWQGGINCPQGPLSPPAWTGPALDRAVIVARILKVTNDWRVTQPKAGGGCLFHSAPVSARSISFLVSTVTVLRSYALHQLHNEKLAKSRHLSRKRSNKNCTFKKQTVFTKWHNVSEYYVIAWNITGGCILDYITQWYVTEVVC